MSQNVISTLDPRCINYIVDKLQSIKTRVRIKAAPIMIQHHVSQRKILEEDITQILQAENMDSKTPQEQYDTIQNAPYKPSTNQITLKTNWTETIKDISKQIDKSQKLRRRAY